MTQSRPPGRDVAGIRCGALRALGAFAGVGAVVAGVAAARAHRRVVHRIGDEARRRVGVAVAALDAGRRDMRRRGLAGRGRAVVTARAVGVGRLMGVSAAGPTGEACRRARMTGDAVPAVRRHMTGIRGGALRALGALARVGAVVAGVAACSAHRRVVHRVGDEARRRVGVAVAALHDAGRNMRRRRHAGGDQTVVAIRSSSCRSPGGRRSRPPSS